MASVLKRSSLFALLMLAGCVTVPSGPSVAVFPGTGKNFDEFRQDDAECRQYAQGQAGLTPDQTAANSGVVSAVVGSALGAAAGAAIGGGHGAAVGAGTGLAFGGLVGTGTAQASSYEVQRRYDVGYQQCMYAKGNRVPVSGRFAGPVVRRYSPETQRYYSAPPRGYAPPPGYYPPPPPGMPPPPPY